MVLPLTSSVIYLWVRIRVMVFNATSNNSSFKSWRSFYLQRKPEYPEKTTDLIYLWYNHNIILQNQMINNKYHTVGTVLKIQQQKNVSKAAKPIPLTYTYLPIPLTHILTDTPNTHILTDTPNTHILDLSLSWIGSVTSIKSDGDKLLIWA